MAYEPKDLTGSLFKNDRKEKDTHADYRGSALLNGDEYWLDAWINKDRNGNSYMSLKFKRKEAARRTDPATSGFPVSDAYPVDDELPPF
jgi:hypothetical protein